MEGLGQFQGPGQAGVFLRFQGKTGGGTGCHRSCSCGSQFLPPPAGRLPPTALVPNNVSEATSQGFATCLPPPQKGQQACEGTWRAHGVPSPRAAPTPTPSSAPRPPQSSELRSEQAPWDAPQTGFTGPTPGPPGHSRGHCLGTRGRSTEA